MFKMSPVSRYLTDNLFKTGCLIICISASRIMSSAHGLKVLPAGAGYGIVIGIGGVFAVLMLGITWLQNRYVSASVNSIRLC